MADIFDQIATHKRDIFDDVEEMGGSMPVSTITGKPIPTPEEQVFQSSKLLRRIAPTAGDVAGTVGAEALLSRAPIPMQYKIPLVALAAGIGSAGAELGAQKAFKEDQDWNKALSEGATATAGQVGLGAVGELTKRFGKYAAEGLADVTIAGSRTKNLLVDRVKEVAEKRASDFIEKIAPESVKKNMGEVGIRKALMDAYDENNALYALYKANMEDVSKMHGGAVPLVETSNAMTQWVKEKMASGNYKNVKLAENDIIRELGFPVSGQGEKSQHVTIRKLLRGEDISPEYVEYLMKNIFPRKTREWDSLLPDVQELRETFKQVVMKDLDSLSVSAGKAAGDAVHKELKRFEAVKRIYDNATVKSRETGEIVKFNPYQFYEEVMTNERSLRRNLPDIWPELYNEAQKMKELSQRISAGTRTSGIAQYFSPGVLAATGNVGLIPWAEGAGVASAFYLMTDAGKKVVGGALKNITNTAAKGIIHSQTPTLDLMKAHK
jgi:hypothetical protein